MTANCPGCGRFATAYEHCEYDGNWNQIYVTTHCGRCGKRVETIV